MDIARRRVALVLGGGGSLGAFEAGVYQALHEAGILPHWIAGTSIGAINAALIAGNAPDERVARLRTFWERISHGSAGGIAASGDARRIANLMASLRARLAGRPGLYTPTPTLPRLFFELPGWGRPWLYDFGPAAATLGELVDFGRLASGEPRLTLNATDLATGDAVLLDNSERELTPEHVLASAALVPDFPPFEIDGRLLCDGGYSANVPLQAVLGQPPEEDTVCIAVDLHASQAEAVWSVDGLAERREDLMFANQTRLAIEALRARYAAREELRAIAAELPRERREALRRQGGLPGDASVALATLSYEGGTERIAQKIFDFSRRSIEDRWAAGLAQGRAAAELLHAASEPEPGGFVLVAPGEPPRGTTGPPVRSNPNVPRPAIPAAA